MEKKKKILILSLSAGGGHNSAAAALKEAFVARGCECEIKNSLDFTPKTKKALITKGHEMFYKYAPGIYSLGYRLEEHLSSANLYADYARYAHPAKQYVLRGGFDAVVCVHIFPAIMLTAAGKKYGYRVPTWFVSTDYTCSPGADRLEVSGLFVPRDCSAVFSAAAQAAGRRPQAIYETGIPVKAAFRQELSREEARELLKKGSGPEAQALAAADPDAPLVLLSAGSMGCGHLKKIAVELAAADPGLLTAIFCGNNRTLLGQIRKAGRDLKNLIPVGFTEEMPLWMHAGDLMISKPGGLTSTEAAVSGLPLLLIDEVPGLETHNMAYLVKHGCAARGKTAEDVIRMAKILLEHEKERAGIRRRQKTLFSADAAGQITNEILVSSVPSTAAPGGDGYSAGSSGRTGC